MPKQERILELDGVRGLAIFMVLLCHYIQIPLLGVSGWWPKYVAKSLSLTWAGVDLFFVLSGFLIGGILIDNKVSPTFFRTFYVRRAMRILPLYFFVLGLFVVLRDRIASPHLFDHLIPIWCYVSFTQNVALIPYPEGTSYFLGATWSLAVEEQFYLILPVLVWLAPRHALLPLFTAGIIGAVLLRALLPGHAAFLLMPSRADSLLSGAVVALLVRSEGFMTWLLCHKRVLVSVFAIFLVGAGAMTAKPWSPWAHSYLWLAFLFASFLIVVLTNAVSWINRLLITGWLRWLGRISYGVYLLHTPISGILHWCLAGTGLLAFQTTTDMAITALATVITLALAALSFRYFEGPFLRFGHEFKYAVATPGLRAAETSRSRKLPPETGFGRSPGSSPPC